MQAAHGRRMHAGIVLWVCRANKRDMQHPAPSGCVRAQDRLPQWLTCASESRSRAALQASASEALARSGRALRRLCAQAPGRQAPAATAARTPQRCTLCNTSRVFQASSRHLSDRASYRELSIASGRCAQTSVPPWLESANSTCVGHYHQPAHWRHKRVDREEQCSPALLACAVGLPFVHSEPLLPVPRCFAAGSQRRAPWQATA